ncbi:MAG: hypothetical protein KBC98_00040 [Candidatus Pacebacteria bacterium]|nr:hypothetical protein [Candidatus Paceibacterota bacterium]
MKNYLYLAALCCTLSSCDSWGSKDETIVEDPSKGFFTKTTFCLPWDAIDDKADNITTEIIGQIPDWFEMQYPAYTATSMSVIPEGTPGAGLYIFYEEKNVPDDSDEFLIDPSASLVGKLPAIKAGKKPTSGGGVFHDYTNVFIRYTLENEYYVPKIMEASQVAVLIKLDVPELETSDMLHTKYGTRKHPIPEDRSRWHVGKE